MPDRGREWSCKIGYVLPDRLFDGADQPLRRAVMDTYEDMTKTPPNFCESGWGHLLPNLGIARTEQMLNELSARFNIDGKPELAQMVDGILTVLSYEERAYRTIDS